MYIDYVRLCINRRYVKRVEMSRPCHLVLGKSVRLQYFLPCLERRSKSAFVIVSLLHTLPYGRKGSGMCINPSFIIYLTYSILPNPHQPTICEKNLFQLTVTYSDIGTELNPTNASTSKYTLIIVYKNVSTKIGTISGHHATFSSRTFPSR